MDILIAGIVIVYTVILICCICTGKSRLKTLKESKIEEFTVETEKQCEEIKKQKQKEVDIFTKELDNKIEKLTISLKEKEKRYKEVNKDLEVYKRDRMGDIDNSVKDYYEVKLSDINRLISEIKEEREKELEKQKQIQTKEISEIKEELEDLRSQRTAVNEEILRQREVQEKEDFYKIQLSETDKPDIEILRATAPRLQHPEAINKIIWSNYYQKPLAELRKRLLPNGDYSGIYKLTRLKTGEVYIGQTTSIDKRFQDHVKSALGVGTLTSSQLHRTMAADGPENFTFEILEKVPKEKLKEKESYYIDFYDSKNYGLNTVRGQEK